MIMIKIIIVVRWCESDTEQEGRSQIVPMTNNRWAFFKELLFGKRQN